MTLNEFIEKALYGTGGFVRSGHGPGIDKERDENLAFFLLYRLCDPRCKESAEVLEAIAKHRTRSAIELATPKEGQ